MMNNHLIMTTTMMKMQALRRTVCSAAAGLGAVAHSVLLGWDSVLLLLGWEEEIA